MLLAAAFTGCASNKEVSKVQETVEPQRKVRMQQIRIKNPAVENGVIYGRLFKPQEEGKFPLIITSHGYNGSNMDFGDDCNYYAKNGFAAFCYDFAGGSARSLSTGSSTEMTLLTEKDNLLTLVNYFSTQDYIDTDNIILMGGSQGGLVTALVADEIPSKIKAVALYYPAFCIPDDWRKQFPTTDKIPNVMNFWGLDLGKPFFEVATAMHVEEVTGKYAGPVLIIHGNLDDIVPLRYAQDAEKRYPNAKLTVLSGERHGFSPTGAIQARKMVLEHAQAAMK